MKAYYIVLITSIIFPLGNLYAQQLQWAKHIGGSGFDYCKIASDSQNNIYLSGSFQYDCHLASAYWSSNGHNDLFLIKYDPAGNEVWAKKFGGNNYAIPNEPWKNMERISEIIYDSVLNYLYLSGNFYGTLLIDSAKIISTGQMDSFLAKFDLDGNCIWIKKAGSTIDDFSSGLCVDENEDIIWAGFIEELGTVDTVTHNAGSFMVKYSPDGSLIWIKRIIGSQHSLGRISVRNDCVYFGTYYNDNVNIDTVFIQAVSGYDVLAAKYNLNLNKLCWINIFSGNDGVSDRIWDIALLDSNNIYITGSFEDSINMNDTTFNNGIYSEVYYLKLNHSGKVEWLHQCHNLSQNKSFPSQIAIDNNKNVYFSGSFKTRVIFGQDTLFATDENTYITKMDSSGNFIGQIQFGEAQNSDIQVLNDGSIVVCGQQMNTTVIGDTSFVKYSGGFNDFDIYLAKFDAITGMQTIGKPKDDKLFIYANPTSGLCTITIPSEFEHEKNLILYVYDQQGRLLKEAKVELDAENIRLDMEALAKGMYTAVLSNGQKKFSGKIVFQ